METPLETKTTPLEEQISTETPEAGEGGATEEDLPSDFFDEFNKEEFIQGLSIIDSWDEGAPLSERFSDSKNIGSAKDNDISLMSDHLDDKREYSRNKSKFFDSPKDVYDLPKSTYRDEKKRESQSPNSSRLDDFIKPGSRRDPSKTNQAIKKDKEEKVKEYLAKSLESSDDLRPPGTELDDYFDENKQIKKEKSPIKRSRSREPQHVQMKLSHRIRESPVRASRQPKWSPRYSPRRLSPLRRSPGRPFYKRPYSPQKYNARPMNKRYSPIRGNRRPSPRRFSPRRTSPRRSRFSPRRPSPRRSPRRIRRSRSRSPFKRSHEYRQSRSRSPSSKNHTDRFLYPADSDLPPMFASSGPPMSAPYHMGPGPYPGPIPSEFPSGPNYSYTPAYGGGFNNSTPYEYGGQPAIPNLMSVPTPNIASAPAPLPNAPLPPNPVPAPMMVPAPNISPSVPNLSPVKIEAKAETPYNALAKLVAEGKISREDYLKLAPNKGASSGLETNHRVVVLQRCNNAVNKLSKLHLPNHLLLHNSMLDGHSEIKYIAPKYCSPLKRQPPIEFLFTKANVSATAQQNKHLVDSIIASLPELEKVITRAKKKAPKNTRDAAVQTSKPYCDVCEIRENMQFHSASTSIDPEHFCTTVHTQVVEQDLMNSKSVFNPSGSIGDSSSMSIAHLTPAQLVSQLAARAKTLKQTDPPMSNQYKQNPSNSYDYDYEGRGGQQYSNYKNYRY